MNKLNKQGIKILKIIFSNTGRRISLFVSLILMLVLSGILLSSFFLTDSTLNKLAKSNYFQNKIMQVLEENNISSKGPISITFNNFSSADITLEEGKLSNFENLVGHDINLKVNFVKFWVTGSNIVPQTSHTIAPTKKRYVLITNL